MNKQPMTLAQAKAEIERLHMGETIIQGFPFRPSPDPSIDRQQGLQMALDIVSRVQEPSEDDRAALWLMKEMRYEMYWSQIAGWHKWEEDDWVLFPPPSKKPRSWGGRGD